MSNLFWYDVWNAESDDLSSIYDYAFGSGVVGCTTSLDTFDNKSVLKLTWEDEGYSRSGFKLGSNMSIDVSEYNSFNMMWYCNSEADAMRLQFYGDGGVQLNVLPDQSMNFSEWRVTSVLLDTATTVNHDWTDLDHINLYCYQTPSKSPIYIHRVWFSRYGYDGARWLT